MAAKAELRVSIDADLKASVDALAKASGRPPAAIVEQALRLVLDPLPAFAAAQRLLASQQARQTALEDQIRVIADFVVDAARQQAEGGSQ